MSNQCEPSTEHNNGEEVDDSDTRSCGWSHLNIDGGDVQNELTTHFVMIGSALGEACSCDTSRNPVVTENPATEKKPDQPISR